MPFAAVDGGLLNSNLSSGSFARPAADLVTAAAGGALVAAGGALTD